MCRDHNRNGGELKGHSIDTTTFAFGLAAIQIPRRGQNKLIHEHEPYEKHARDKQNVDRDTGDHESFFLPSFLKYRCTYRRIRSKRRRMAIKKMRIANKPLDVIPKSTIKEAVTKLMNSIRNLPKVNETTRK